LTENEGDKPGYHHGDLRGALLKAARIILEEQGPRALTLREAARRAGVSHAAPRYHFTSLRVFMADCAATGFDELAEHLTRAWAKADGDSDPEAGLSEMGMAYVLFAMRNRAVFRLMFDRDTYAAPIPILGAGQWRYGTGPDGRPGEDCPCRLDALVSRPWLCDSDLGGQDRRAQTTAGRRG
jgi:AcrR family transcriptional regulator